MRKGSYKPCVECRHIILYEGYKSGEHSKCGKSPEDQNVSGPMEPTKENYHWFQYCSVVREHGFDGCDFWFRRKGYCQKFEAA